MTFTKTRTAEPEVTYRSWNFTYKRPRTGGWPLLTRTGWEQGGRKPAHVVPKVLTIQVRQLGGEAPAVSSVHVRGAWPNGTEYTGQLQAADAKPGLAMVIYQPDWVAELAGDAVARAAREAG